MPRLNAEAFVRAYLESNLEGVVVHTRVPDPRPQRLVVVTRAGGGRLGRLLDRPGVHLMVYGGSEWETSELATEVGELMDALNRSDEAFLAGIDRVEEESLRSDPDTRTQPDTPRWFGSYTMTTHKY